MTMNHPKNQYDCESPNQDISRRNNDPRKNILKSIKVHHKLNHYLIKLRTLLAVAESTSNLFFSLHIIHKINKA